MADKKTFKDMAGALPTTTSDMSKVMVQMADGSVGWIKKEDLAQVAAGLMPVATTNTKGLAPAYSVPLRVINGTNSAKLYEVCTLKEFTSAGLLVAIKQYIGKCRIACISVNRHNTSGQILNAINEPITIESFNVYINKTTNKLAVEVSGYFSLYVLPLSYNGNVQFNLTETTDDGYVLVE